MLIQNNAFLKQVSNEVASADEAKELYQKLLSEAILHSDAVGLAAVQIGILGRAFIMQDRDEWLFLINPKLDKIVDSQMIESTEGCLSFPGKSVITRRAKQITVSTQRLDDFDGERQQLTMWDKDSVIFQHEFDHLNGILLFDRVFIKQKRNDLCNCGKLDIDGKQLKYKKCCGI